MGVEKRKSYKEYWLPGWPRPSFDTACLLQQIVNARDPLQKFNELKEKIPSPHKERAERMASLVKQQKEREMLKKLMEKYRGESYEQ